MQEVLFTENILSDIFKLLSYDSFKVPSFVAKIEINVCKTYFKNFVKHI